MAWAVKFEIEFGRFFPAGDYVELRKRLDAHFAAEMSAEERIVFRRSVTYTRWTFEKFTKEIGVLHPAGPTALTPLQDHEWPREYQAQQPIRSLGSLVELSNQVLAVDERLKALIEGLEPGMHQFRPITFLQPNSEPFPGSYFILVIGRFVDSFLPEATEQRLWRLETYENSEGQPVSMGKYTCIAAMAESFAGVAFSRQVIGGAHLWRERRMLGHDIYLSETLRDAIKKAKLTMPPLFSVKEI